MGKISIVCKTCGKEFICYQIKPRIFCSRECLYKDKKPPEIVKCTCGKEFVKLRPTNKYCSRKCFMEAGTYKNFNNRIINPLGHH